MGELGGGVEWEPEAPVRLEKPGRKEVGWSIVVV
jgi:hypothetical protein